MDKVLIICGPTATGKTSLAIQLAKKYHGEIISADSRQVYRGMDIGTGKDIPENSKFQIPNSKFEVQNKKFHIGFRNKEGVPIWLVDIVDPDYTFNVGEYTQLARKVIEDIQNRDKLPIITGGTGLYIKALVEPLPMTRIPPDPILREKLEKLSLEELTTLLREKSSHKLEQMNNSDRNNPRRLIRAIEIANFDPSSPPNPSTPPEFLHHPLFIGLTAPREELARLIDSRVEERVRQGIIQEIRELLSHGFTWEMPAMEALGYRQWKEFFAKKKSKEEVIREWKLAEHQYAKRQMTWFKKQPGILWFDTTRPGWFGNVEKCTEAWYTSK